MNEKLPREGDEADPKFVLGLLRNEADKAGLIDEGDGTYSSRSWDRAHLAVGENGTVTLGDRDGVLYAAKAEYFSLDLARVYLDEIAARPARDDS